MLNRGIHQGCQVLEFALQAPLRLVSAAFDASGLKRRRKYPRQRSSQSGLSGRSSCCINVRQAVSDGLAVKAFQYRSIDAPA